LHPTPTVSYESEEDGRLIRPCHCRGSMRYVHEKCLKSWRLRNLSSERTFWQCPTCLYRYRLQRVVWGSIVSSRYTRLLLTGLVFVGTVFALGFVADPIIDMVVDPAGFIGSTMGVIERAPMLDEPSTWSFHFLKGFASLGLLGFAKSMAVLPMHYFGARPARNRMSNVRWLTVIIGVVMFLTAVWKLVHTWSSELLKRVGERVMDVPLEGDDDETENAQPGAGE